jgi:hypothetical protein
MEANEKAKELVDKFKATTHPISRIMTDGKQCALICVREILKIKTLRVTKLDAKLDGYSELESVEFWQEVKTEIEKI